MTDEKKNEFIKYYKSSIEKNQNDPDRVLHCLKKLDTLRIGVEHLQETGIGRTVNAIRGLEGEAGELAKNLVDKWKRLVAESESIGNKSENEKEELPEKIETIKVHHSKSMSSSSSKEKENSKKSSKHHSSSSHHHHHTSSTHHSSSSKDHKDKKSNDSKSSESKHHKSSSSSSSSHHHSSSKANITTTNSSSSSSKKRSIEEDASLDATKENETKAKRLKIESDERSDSKKSSSKSSSSSKSKEHKHSSKRKNSKDKNELSEFDGSTGDIGFAEALMMFDMPSTSSSSGSKSKKQLADKMVSVKSSSGNGSSSSVATSKSESKSSLKIHKSLSAPTASSSSSSNSRPSTSTAAATTASAESSRKSLQTLTQPPKLLTQKPKLDLLPDIVSDIVIPDYRPLPLNTAIKDYIDSNFGANESASSRHLRKMEEAVQFQESFSSKANRTKVFSGNSKTRTQIPTLFDMCIRILQENIDFLECTGGVPFSILQPVLQRAKPDQLSAIEYYNPYLLEESDILWKPHCQRKWKHKQPAEMETWREMFERCTREDDEKLSRLTQNIKQHQEISSNGIQKTKMAYVDSFVKPPRGIMRKQEQFGTNRKLVASPAARVDALKHLAPNIVSGKVGDVRLRIAAGLRDDAQQMVGRGTMQRGNIAKKAPLMAKILQKFKR